MSRFQEITVASCVCLEFVEESKKAESRKVGHNFRASA